MIAARAVDSVTLAPNRQTRSDAFTALIESHQRGLGIVFLALVVAAGLGAFHALEPGHGKTIVAAYLVGARGTAHHAVFLGCIVTASHTLGVYLLGVVTLYASRYVLPERLYPWLGVLSGITIAGLGFFLFLRRYAGREPGHGHAHGEQGAHALRHHHPHDHTHSHHARADHAHPHAPSIEHVTLRELFALGITGGLVPCPAALVVLLSALSLGRVGFGLLLIVAFSIGLAAVLIAIGLLMVYARRLMSRVQGEGAIVTRWLPLTSAAVMTVLGLAIAVQALMTAGIVHVKL
jgi:ABC-type nickel/cobalt efflux system permease component RcnA